MKILVLAIILFSLYLIYRLSFPKQAEDRRGDEPRPPKPVDEDEAVPKSRFVLDFQRQPLPTPAMPENSDKQEENASIFAAENEKPNAVIPPEELGEVFGEDVNPDDLDIEPDASETEETDNDGEADEEAEEIRQSAGEIEGYAGGFTYDELATVIHETDKPEAMTKAAVETLRDLSTTDMFEKLVSGDAGKAARIASILDRNEQSLASQDEDVADEKDTEYQDFDIGQFLS
ncbi:MAG: hypothetical protein LBS03_03425 [Bacteroidales bacterium]|jgi:hypothetical protein|nr:hypothetical protein [Bacteroidales bacterium]